MNDARETRPRESSTSRHKERVQLYRDRAAQALVWFLPTGPNWAGRTRSTHRGQSRPTPAIRELPRRRWALPFPSSAANRTPRSTRPRHRLRGQLDLTPHGSPHACRWGSLPRGLPEDERANARPRPCPNAPAAVARPAVARHRGAGGEGERERGGAGSGASGSDGTRASHRRAQSHQSTDQPHRRAAQPTNAATLSAAWKLARRCSPCPGRYAVQDLRCSWPVHGWRLRRAQPNRALMRMSIRFAARRSSRRRRRRSPAFRVAGSPPSAEMSNRLEGLPGAAEGGVAACSPARQPRRSAVLRGGTVSRSSAHRAVLRRSTR